MTHTVPTRRSSDRRTDGGHEKKMADQANAPCKRTSCSNAAARHWLHAAIVSMRDAEPSGESRNMARGRRVAGGTPMPRRWHDARHHARQQRDHDQRSEEHTSELQSLMRISY